MLQWAYFMRRYYNLNLISAKLLQCLQEMPEGRIQNPAEYILRQLTHVTQLVCESSKIMDEDLETPPEEILNMFKSFKTKSIVNLSL